MAPKRATPESVRRAPAEWSYPRDRGANIGSSEANASLWRLADPPTPAPVDEAWLERLPAHRREDVRDFLEEAVSTCPYCERPVRRSDPRGLDADERLGCLGCVTTVIGKCGVCRAEITRQHTSAPFKDGMAHKACADRRR